MSESRGGFRGKFSTDEWMALVLQSAGYAANAFPDRRTKLLLIARILPLVEKNFNMIELGPRQTGKTFLLRNLFCRAFRRHHAAARPRRRICF